MKLFGLFALFSALAFNALADEPITAPSMSLKSDVFQKGQWEAGGGAAAFFGPFAATKNRPTHDYALAVGNVGYMLSDVKEWGWARGNFETLCELFAGPVFVGRGNYVAGMTLWGRYNFVQPGWKVVPYGQIGAGAGATDIDQNVIGQVFQFNLNAAVGLRYFIRPDLALNGEYRYQHISNANTGPRNIGLNSQGFYLGVSKFF